jgi:general secretion pathway protein I
MRRRHAVRGFTLLEVLVAVGILATALAAIVAAGANYADGAAYLRDKTLALWVAHNRMTEIELSPAAPALGDSDADVEMGGITWTWRATVQETQDPKLHRVDLRVERKDDRRKPAGAYAALSGFFSTASKPVQ